MEGIALCQNWLFLNRENWEAGERLPNSLPTTTAPGSTGENDVASLRAHAEAAGMFPTMSYYKF